MCIMYIYRKYMDSAQVNFHICHYLVSYLLFPRFSSTSPTFQTVFKRFQLRSTCSPTGMNRRSTKKSTYIEDEADELDVKTSVKLQAAQGRWMVRDTLKSLGRLLGTARDMNTRKMRYAKRCQNREERLKKTHGTSSLETHTSNKPVCWICHKFNLHGKKVQPIRPKNGPPWANSARGPPGDDLDDTPFAIRFAGRDSCFKCDESEGDSESQSEEEEVDPRGRRHVKQSQATQSLRNYVRKAENKHPRR